MKNNNKVSNSSLSILGKKVYYQEKKNAILLPTLVMAFNKAEKRYFLNHHWEVIRHRLSDRLISRLLKAKYLTYYGQRWTN